MFDQASGYTTAPVPAHVRPDLVIDFDYYRPQGIEQTDVYAAWHKLHDGPDIVWTPRNGGHWILTRAEDVKWVQENYEIFSHEEFSIPRIATKIRMPPLTVDPPDHARYRAVLNPSFAPARVREMADKARALTVDLIDLLAAKGRCEFVNEFARIMPVTVFLGLVDLPLDRREEFVEWAAGYISASDQGVRDAYLGKVTRYLSTVLEDRFENPGPDLLSRIVGWRKDPRCQGEHEVSGMAMLVFFGGLDTVANMLSFTARHLAEHPELRCRLIREPSIVPQAVEEYFRRHGLSNTGRLVKRGTDRKDVHFAQGDMVMVPISMSSMDDREYANPLIVDFDRNAPGHNTFGNGPHRCVGAGLARAEMRIFLEEWVKRIPNFCLDPELPAHTHSGPVNGISQLGLLFRREP